MKGDGISGSLSPSEKPPQLGGEKGMIVMAKKTVAMLDAEVEELRKQIAQLTELVTTLTREIERKDRQARESAESARHQVLDPDASIQYCVRVLFEDGHKEVTTQLSAREFFELKEKYFSAYKKAHKVRQSGASTPSDQYMIGFLGFRCRERIKTWQEKR